MEFISIKEAAKRWGLTERMVRGYCNEKRIEGAIFENRTWLIPDDAEKPQRRTTKPPQKEKPVSNSLVKRILYEKGKNNHYGIYESYIDPMPTHPWGTGVVFSYSRFLLAREMKKCSMSGVG